jgi:hypothetical protein
LGNPQEIPKREILRDCTRGPLPCEGGKKFLGSDIILPMQSFQSLPDARCGTNGRNPEDWKDFKILAIVQQILKVALLFPVLERGILLSSRKGAWDRVRKGLVPFEAGGTIPTRDF